MRKAGHGDKRGVIIKQMCVGMCFFFLLNVRTVAYLHSAFVLIVSVSPLSECR